MNLLGARVVVTRAVDHSSELVELLRAAGADVVELPTIEIIEPESWDAMDDALRRLEEFDWAAFTSANAVRSFVGRVAALGIPVEELARLRIAVVGPATAEALRASGLSVGLVADQANAEGLAAALGEGAGRSILIPRAETVPRSMRETLEQGGWRVEEVPAYRTVTARPPQDVLATVRAGEFDVLTFTSGSTVSGFVELVGPADRLGLDGKAHDKTVAVIGPKTAAVAAGAGFVVDVVAEEQSARGLVRALSAHR